MTKHFILFSFAGALAAGLSHAADDVPSAPDTEPTLRPVVVRGHSADARQGTAIKRQTPEISDAVTAEDMNALFTPSAAEALQHMAGIQLSRDRGEAGTVTLRGLPQIETTLNGREVFTAGGGRTLDLSDIPAEMLRSVTVLKSAAANHLGGGLAGVVDLKTWRPFDFVQPQAQVSARAVSSDLAGRGAAQGSVLLSNRWRTGGDSEWGALLNLSVQNKAWREDQTVVGTPAGLRNDLVPGQSVYAPNGTTVSRSEGLRKRVGGHLMLQWRPSAQWDLYAEAASARFSTRQDTHQFTTSPGARAAAVPGSVSLFPGTADVQSLTWAQAPYATQGFARDTVDRTTQQAVGGSWTGDDLTLSADLSRTRSHNHLDFTSLGLNGVAPALTQNVAGATPAFGVSGADPSRLDSFTSTGLVRAIRPFDGSLSAARVDGDLQVRHDWVESVAFGARWARRWASNMPGQVVYASPSVAAPYAAGWVHPAPDTGMLTGDPALTRDPSGLRQTLGLTDTVPSSNWLGAWTIDEQTSAGYAMARIRHPSLRLDGNVGIRLQQTRAWVQGYESTPTSGGVQPVATLASDLDVLPSINLRHEWAPELYVRAALSKTITRPDFGRVAPSLTLHPVLLTGTAGNPRLNPVRARNLDLALERYWGPSSRAHLTVFHKQIDGFIASVIGPEVHNGAVYQVNRFQNAQSASLHGLEVGVRESFSQQPGWLRGLTLEASYTLVNGTTLDLAAHQTTPLQNVSRHSANLVGSYASGPWSLRLAYNWRGRYVSSVVNVTGLGSVPVYVKPQGWLDAAVVYRHNDRLSFQVSGSNLLRTQRSAYLGVVTRPYSVWKNDLQMAAAVMVRF